MEDTKEITYTPLEHYDSTVGLDDSMYDNMPYVRDVTLCNGETVRRFSGNVFKFFTYSLEDQCKVGGD